MSPRLSARKSGFTLVELLVVIAVLAILASVLFPVFAQVREKGRRTACLSNEHQLGMALMEYQQDNDECFPNGVNPADGRPFWSGEGWAGQCFSYLHSTDVLRCPDDPTPSTGLHNQTVSYGYNINLVSGVEYFQGTAPGGLSLSNLSAPAQTVALFEVTGVTVNLMSASEGASPTFAPGTDFSASSNGLDNRLYAQTNAFTSTDNQYATGALGGRPPLPPSQFQLSMGRHSGGSNFLLADGHVRWFFGSAVSSGLNAPGPLCAQDNLPALPDCAGQPIPFDPDPVLRAAGTANPSFRATFSAE